MTTMGHDNPLIMRTCSLPPLGTIYPQIRLTPDLPTFSYASSIPGSGETSGFAQPQVPNE